MATIQKLSYTASEIDEKLGKIDDVVQTTGNSETAVMSQKAVTDLILERMPRLNILLCDNYISVDTVSGTVTIPATTELMTGDFVKVVEEDIVISLQEVTNTSGNYILYDKRNDTFEAYARWSLPNIDMSNYYYLCSIRRGWSGYDWKPSCDLSVPHYMNGELFGCGIPTDLMPRLNIGVCYNYISIDNANGTITIPANTELMSGAFYMVTSEDTVIAMNDIHNTSGNVILFNKTTKEFENIAPYSYGTIDTSNYFYAFFVRRNTSGLPFKSCADISTPYYVDGVLYGGDTRDLIQVEKDFMRIFIPYSQRASFYVEPNPNIPTLFIKFDTLRIRGYIKGEWFSTNYTCESIATECGVSLVTSTKGVEGCLQIPDEYGLVFDLGVKQFKLIHRNNINDANYKAVIFSESASMVYCIPSLLEVYTDNENKRLEAKIGTEDTFAISTEKVQSFAGLFNGSNNVETFMFFTDPHLCQHEGDTWRTEFDEYMSTLKKYYNESPVTRVFCGGDWLGGTISDASDACYRLGLADAKMRESFAEYYNMRGNHESNFSYDGVNPVLNRNTIKNLMFRKEGKTYYSVDGDNSKFFIFDTQDESDSLFDSVHLIEQSVWFVEALKNNTTENIIMMMHIVLAFNDATGEFSNVYPTPNQLTLIANAFNERSNIIVNGTNYDFIDAVGKVKFMMAGHTHEDYTTTVNGIPTAITTNLREGGIPTFDLCLADYNNNKLHLVRVGTGENRTIDI